MKYVFIFFTFLAFQACLKSGSSVAEFSVTAQEDGYSPDKIEVGPDVEKVILTFTRTTDSTCAREVVLEDQDINVELPLNEPVKITFNMKGSKEITFGCHMDKMHKAVIFKN